MKPPMTDKPYSAACERNQEPILGVLRERFTAPGLVLEIGSGTGQHAAFLPAHLPHLTWQPSDVAEHLPGINAWCQDAALPNVKQPVVLDVTTANWPLTHCDYVFSANTAHIMSWPAVEALFRGVATVLAPGGLFALYGPFMRDGRHTAESNARFDLSLRQRDPVMGIRDRADLDTLARACGMSRCDEYALPANNEVLVWAR